MKATKTKAEVSREINSQIRDFLVRGGVVKGIATGVSGREIGAALPVSFEPRKTPRTPVLAEVQALESRKKSAIPVKNKPRKPRKILLTDDFGEPIRWIWTEK